MSLKIAYTVVYFFIFFGFSFVNNETYSTEKRLFYVERSKSKNIVCYDLNTNTMGVLEYADAQQVRIHGTVTDASKNEPLPFANVALLPKNLVVGVMTDNDRKYPLTFTVKSENIQFSFIGYETLTMPLTEAKNGVLDVKLNPLATALETVVITDSRTRYRNRDNPAVKLIRKAIDNKDKNRIEAHNTCEYERYEKIQFSFTEPIDRIQNDPLFRSFPFLFNHLDTSKLTGRLSLPVFLCETISEHYINKHPKVEKEFLIASRMANFHDFIEQETK